MICFALHNIKFKISGAGKLKSNAIAITYSIPCEAKDISLQSQYGYKELNAEVKLFVEELKVSLLGHWQHNLCLIQNIPIRLVMTMKMKMTKVQRRRNE